MTNRNINQHGPRQQIWVSWLAGAPLITNMGDLIQILWMLAVLLPGTQKILLSGRQTMNESTTHTRDYSIENGLGNIKKKTSIILLFLKKPCKKWVEKKIDKNLNRIRRFKARSQRPADQARDNNKELLVFWHWNIGNPLTSI